MLLVSLEILRAFRYGNRAAKLRLEFVAAHHLGRGEQRARRPVAPLGTRHWNRLHNIRHPQRVDLVSRLHGFLLQIKKHLGHARSLLRQREHGFVHHLHAQCGFHSLAASVSHPEVDARIVTRLVGRRIRRSLDLQLVGRLHEDQAVIADRPRILPEKIRVDIDRARQVRRRGQRQFRLPVHHIQVARQHCLPFLHHIHVSRAALPGRKHSQRNAIAGAIHRVLRAQQNLIRPVARFQAQRSRRVVSLFVAGLDLDGLLARAGPELDHGHAAIVRRGDLVRVAHRVHLNARHRRSPIGISSDHKNLVLQIWNQRAPFGNSGDRQRRFADRNRLAARLGVACRIFHRRLDEHGRGPMAERTPREVTRQPQVESIRPFPIGLALCRHYLELRHVHARRFDADLRPIHWLSEEVVGAYRTCDMVARPVAALRTLVSSRQVDCHFELGQHVSFHVKRQFRGVRARFLGPHHGSQMIRAQVHFVRQCELG